MPNFVLSAFTLDSIPMHWISHEQKIQIILQLYID